MRRRLIWQAIATTSMVALAFVIPLATLVATFAADRALSAAEREAENVARYMALRAPATLSEDDLAEIMGDATPGHQVSIVTAQGDVIGAEIGVDEDLSTAMAGMASRVRVDGGGVVYLPVVVADGSSSVVRVFAPERDLRRGVARSWLILAGLGVSLVAIAVLVADGIGRSIVRPVTELSASAAKLGAGDMQARVTPDGPAEIQTMGIEFNRLADQIGSLVVSEREAAADLSHRLRTPLTALRLDVEAMEASGARDRVLDDLSELERTVDYVIAQARRGARTGLPAVRIDIGGVVAERVEFWRALADDQQRTLAAYLADGESTVAMDHDDATVMIDLLIENVFAHTAEGVPMAVTLVHRADDVLLAVEDGGSGLPDEGVLERGRSEGSSSGLGLDIVRRSAEAAGGNIRVGSSRRLGGALVAIRLPLISD